MSASDRHQWVTILSQLNSIVLTSNALRADVTQEALTSGWCGSPPASEKEILDAEVRLGVKLPSSYRSFLSISNGWSPFSGVIKRLLPVHEIARLQTADPGKLADILRCYKEGEPSDSEYLDYETPRNVEASRLRYYAESLLVGIGWGVEDDMILLNPQIITHEDEWEAIFFANWIPGNQRFRSFRDFVLDTVEFQSSHPS